MHRLRVLTRRIRASVRLARGGEEGVPARRAWKRLRSLGRSLGDRRMWDVAFENMAEFGLPVARFRARRAAATRRLRRDLARMDAGALREDLKKTAKQLRQLPAAHLGARVRRLRDAVAATAPTPPVRADVRHAARIQFKKARYLLETCGVAAPAARRLQALLGREHDLHELQRIAGANASVRAHTQVARALTDRAWAPARRSSIAALERLERALGA